MAEGERGDSPPKECSRFFTTVMAWLDLPAKKLARQLDFNAMKLAVL